MISYKLSLYNTAPFIGGPGYALAVPYTAGSGSLVVNSAVGLPAAPFRLTVVTASSRGTGLNEVLTVYGISVVSGNTLTIASVLEGTSDRNYSVGDYCEIRDDAGSITDLNNAALAVTPTVVTGLAATGNSQGTALALSGNNSIQEVTTVPSGSGVSLPTPTLPASVIVINAGSNPLLVYPPAGGTIWNSSSPYSLAAGHATRWVASSTTNWYAVL